VTFLFRLGVPRHCHPTSAALSHAPKVATSRHLFASKRFNHHFPLPLEGVSASRPSPDFFVGCVARGETAVETCPGTAMGCHGLPSEPLQPACPAEPAAGKLLSRETVTSVSTLRFRQQPCVPVHFVQSQTIRRWREAAWN
jgi:hypothetical protein